MVKVQIAPRRRLMRPKSKVTITNKTNKTVTTTMYVSRKSQKQIMNKHQTERQSQTKRKRKRKVKDPTRKGKIMQIWPRFLPSSNIQKDKKVCIFSDELCVRGTYFKIFLGVDVDVGITHISNTFGGERGKHVFN